ncbi:hypothetical protein [Amycolatopsis arida]|uniref:hypothetical protein n=1 Tax=Amycolatopsis arida TaxID=587909 RepID=UPI001FBAD71A|nr:hypothetical protein [Amycolatopsis arida]
MVETIRDGLVTEPFDHAPAERCADHGTLDGVDLQEGLLDALGALGRNGVRNLLRPVAVAGFADVVALLGVGLEAVPALFEHLGDIPLGHPLLDPPSQHLDCGLDPAAGFAKPEGLVGRDEQHAGLL